MAQKHWHRAVSPRMRALLIALLIVITLIFPAANPRTVAQEAEATQEPVLTSTPLPATEAPATEPPPTEIPATEPPPTEIPPTETPIEESTPVETPTEAPTEIITETPTETPTVVVTEIPSSEATPEVRDRGSDDAVLTASVVTSCQMEINDAGDANPYTFNFAAVNTSNISSYSWDFGDSGTANGQTASHTYAAPGSYNIILTCVPNSGPNMILNGSINISNPVIAAFSLTPSTQGYAPFTVNLVNTSTGSSLSYLWEVTGPETYSSTDQHVSFTFSTPGTYTIKLTVSDSGGQSATIEAGVVVLVPPPLADFTLSPSMGAPGVVVTVEGVMDATSGPVDTWTWDFGDGSPTVSGQGPHNHTYPAEGTYSITMSYSGAGGNGSSMKQVVVFTAGGDVTADFTYTLMGNDGSGIRVCFNNTSTGPVETSIWDFGDGSPLVTNNSAVVCHTYAGEGSYTVVLEVIGDNPSVTSTANATVSVIGAPIAQFTASITTLQAGDTVNFDSTPSQGIIDSWAWDFNGDGSIDSTDQNPSNIPFNTVGGHTVRLTVTGPGGTSSAEMTLIVVRAEITCDFSGTLNLTPGTNANYDGIVSNLRGRTATYTWTITGPQNFNFTTEDITVNWGTLGSYLVTFSASTADGSNCTETKSIQVSWPELTCSITGNFTPSPNGSNYTYTANVSNLSGRTATYKWFIDNVEQPETTSTLTRSWSLTTTQDIRVEISTTDNSGECQDSKTLNVRWPTLTCSIGGNINPLPRLPDDPTRSYTYTANLGGVDGRTITYKWFVDGVEQSETGASLTLSWAWNETGPYSVRLEVEADNRDSTVAPCDVTANLNVNIPALVCNAPLGDITPVLNESVTYTRNVQNQFGRTITADSWELQQSDGAGGWITVATGNGNTLQYLFDQPNTQYRIQYSITVTESDDDCTSAWQIINAAGTGVDFTCDAGPFGNMSPANAGANYTYSITMDNTNRIPLEFTWVLIDSTGAERILGTNTSTVDGSVNSPAISGAALGPVDNYTLRVDVKAVDPADSVYECSRSAGLTVGTITVDYTFTVNNNAVEVGQQICLTNTSTTSHGDINSLTYNWNFGTADNSLGSQTSTDQTPPCFSFPNPGTYNIVLTGTNASGLRSATKSVTFRVYGSQSIAINRSSQNIAPANMTFAAVSVNLNAPYTWTFRNVTTGVVIGTRTGQNVSFYFATGGEYEATVSANGPLGTTSATSRFTLLGNDDIRAAFTPSSYNGPAPLYVCFTDRSAGNNINSWNWDFNNDGTIDSTVKNPCTTFSTPAQSYLVRLTVSNTSSKTAFATNVIRTFTALEQNSTFTIIPKGNGLYCFQSQLGGGTTVIGWDFGDGTTINTGDLNYTCHNYGEAGSFVVTMNITNGTETGSVSRPVDVDLTPTPTTPILTASGSCTIGGGAVFTVTNTGATNMLTPDSLKITDASGTVVVVDDSLKLNAGESKTYTVTDHYGTLTLTTLDTGVSASTYCDDPPRLTGSAICQADGSAVFTITNTSIDTDANQSYTIIDAGGSTVQTGTITAAANGGTQTITVSGIYGPLTLTSTGTPASTTDLSVNSNCGEPPVLTASAVCQADGTAVFTIINSSTATDANQSYTITGTSGSVLQTGTITATANGGTQTITVIGAYKDSPLTLTSDGGAQGATTVINFTHDCDEPPVLSGSATCIANGAQFTIINTSDDTAASQNYQVVNSSGGVVKTGTLNIPVNSSTTIEVTGEMGLLTFMTSSPTQGTTASLTIDSRCEEAAVALLSATLEPTVLPAETASGIPVNVTGATCSRGCVDVQIYHTNRNGNWDIYRLVDEPDGTPDADVNLTETEGDFDDMAPSRSPNAEWIVFTSNRDGNWELYLTPTNGNTDQTRRLTYNELAIDTDPVWGPNNFVVFETNRNGNWDLYLLDMTTGEFYQLTSNEGNDINPSWSNEGDKLVFQSDRSGQWQIYEMDMTTFQIRLLSDGTGSDMDPVYSEDDTRIAFRSERDGETSVIYIMSANGANPTPVSNPAGYATNHAWSPDDSLIAYQSDADGDLDVYVYQVGSGETRKLTDNAIPDYAPTWRCGTDEVIFTSDIPGTPDIFKAEALPITDPGIAVDEEADRLTEDQMDDIYPEGHPVEENASREGRLPDLQGNLTGETSFLKPDVSILPPDLSLDTGIAWEDIGDTCAPSGFRDDIIPISPEANS